MHKRIHFYPLCRISFSLILIIFENVTKIVFRCKSFDSLILHKCTRAKVSEQQSTFSVRLYNDPSFPISSDENHNVII